MPDYDNTDVHCNHHRHDERCEAWAGLCDDNANDDCVHCDCCCTCLGCEYGPQDGMLMFPERSRS